MALGTYSAASLGFKSIPIASCAIAVVAVLLICILRMRARGLSAWICISIGLVAGFSLTGRGIRDAHDMSMDISGRRNVVCTGRVEGDPMLLPYGKRFDVTLLKCLDARGDWHDARGRVRLTTRIADQDIGRFDVVKFAASLKAPASRHNRASFDYEAYLGSKGIAAVGSVKRPVEIQRKMDAGLVSSVIFRLQEKISSAISASLRGEARGIAYALSLARREFMDDKIKEAFAQSGLAHLMAISGVHVGFIAAMIYFLLKSIMRFFPALILRFPLSRVASFLTIPFIWLYVALASFPVSAARASIMLTIYLVGVVFLRHPDILNTLAVAVVALLFVWPLSIVDASFQLSVLAVLGIIVIAGPMQTFVHSGLDGNSVAKRLARFVLASFVVSMAATAATLPMMAYHFKFITAIGLMANLIAVPFTGFVVIPLVFISELASIVSMPLSTYAWRLAAPFLDALAGMARISSEVGAPLVVQYVPSAFEICLMYAAIAALVFWRRLPYRRAVLALMALVVILDVSYWRLCPMLSDELKVYVLDVGQGDSALVRFPGGRSLLIDGGGQRGQSMDVGRYVVAPELLSLSIRRLDDIVLTHPHHDHYMGLSYVISKFHPRRIWLNGLDAPEEEAEEWQVFKDAVEKSDAESRVCKGDVVLDDTGGARVELISPQGPIHDINDSSIVIRISYGSSSFLFMGDMTSGGEAALLSSGRDIRADVIKIGHHGARDSTGGALLAAARPRHALISAGKDNVYGVPTDEVLARLSAHGIEILRTDVNGMISATADGRTLSVVPMVK
jgi:competence protein ComEC